MSTIDLAAIGNGAFGALIDSHGRFVWCCLGQFNGDPLFNCLLNNNSDESGFFDVLLEDFEYAEQSYLELSTVLVTTLHSCNGDAIEIRDFAPRFYLFDRIFRPFQIFRKITRLKGDPRISIRMRPTFEYNSKDGFQTRGSHHVRYCGPNATWRLTMNMSVKHVLEEKFFLMGKEPLYMVLGADESFADSLSTVTNSFLLKTVAFWNTWCQSVCLPVEYQEVLVRALTTICMLQVEDSGGLLSSLTFGLPLGPFSPSTRDTRVCRLLELCLSLPVLRDAGLFDVCRKFLRFAKEVCFNLDAPQHTYTASGNSCRLWAMELQPCLAGYRGLGGEVYSGGHFPGRVPEADEEPGDEDREKQLTTKAVVYCLLVSALAHAFFDIRLSKEFCTQKLYSKLEFYASYACDNFDTVLQGYRSWCTASQSSASCPRPRPTAIGSFFDGDVEFFSHQQGVTESDKDETREGEEPPSVHCLSTVLCWTAADHLHRIALQYYGDREKAEYWRKRAEGIHEAICSHGWNPKCRAFTSYWGSDYVGPSLLRLGELCFIQSRDERFLGTVRAFEMDALGHAVCLSTHADTSSRKGISDCAVGEDEEVPPVRSACFLTSTLLWYCEALRSTGSHVESRRLLDSLLRCSTQRGILSEAVDLKTMELWGNTPSMSASVSIVRVASRLSRTWWDG